MNLSKRSRATGWAVSVQGGERSRPGCSSARPRAELESALSQPGVRRDGRTSANGKGAVRCARGGRAPHPNQIRGAGLRLLQRSCVWLALLAVVSGLTPVFGANPGQLPALTTASGNPRLPGKFVWADLVTDDILAAQKFYTALFGWKFYDYGGYFIGMNDDRPLCGMFQRPRPKDRVAVPRWFGYISVPSVARAEEAVTKAGGKVLAAPKKMPGRGEQAVFADPEGALFGVIKSSAGDPEDFLAEPGDWIWIQLLSRDGRKAAEFYRTVSGYEIVENTKSNHVSDFVLASKGYARATVRTIRTDAAKAQPTWLPFVRVRNISESVAKAKALGGKGLIEPKPELFDGRVALIADPTGAAIGILEWTAGLEKGGVK